MAEKKHILIICGEASGDLHAAELVRALKKINPQLTISGVGGTLLRQAGVEIYYDIKNLAVLGLFDVLKKLPKFIELKNYLLEKIRTKRPDLIILVDFSGFNLRFAREINANIPIIYYISPQVWASRRGRIKTIKKYISKMLVIFELEQDFYKRYGIDADFIGHPLLDIVAPTMEKKEFLEKHELSTSKLTIALLPGSRASEILNILPIMLKTSLLIQEKIKNIQFVIAKSPHVDWHIYHQVINDTQIDLRLIEDRTYDCLNIADFCLVASGTATIETAIMQKPFVVIYKMNLLNYLLYRPQIKVPYIGMINIVAAKKIIPEFIQFQARPKKISRKILKILAQVSEMERIKKDLARVKSLLGEKGASLRAAQIINDFLIFQ